MVQEIYLLRHGEIDTGGKKRFIGHTDLPLSDSGRAQAARLRDELSCVPFSSVFAVI